MYKEAADLYIATGSWTELEIKLLKKTKYFFFIRNGQENKKNLGKRKVVGIRSTGAKPWKDTYERDVFRFS